MRNYLRSALAATLLAVATTIALTATPAQSAPPDYHTVIYYYYSDSSHATEVGIGYHFRCPDGNYKYLTGERTAYFTSITVPYCF
ncbi:hypothetical protein [Micromonospora sp. LOL_021]|uniref:hypothetical protein n=1 Tax=Micromonospora sp. LOL_021 TaxID=3345417 RepID=UPI003A86D12C